MVRKRGIGGWHLRPGLVSAREQARPAAQQSEDDSLREKINQPDVLEGYPVDGTLKPIRSIWRLLPLPRATDISLAALRQAGVRLHTYQTV